MSAMGREETYEDLIGLHNQRIDELSATLLWEYQNKKRKYKGNLYYNIGLYHLFRFEFGEAKAYLELAIEEENLEFGDPEYRKSPAFKSYEVFFKSGEPIMGVRLGQVIEEMSKKIPKIEREIKQLAKQK